MRLDGRIEPILILLFVAMVFFTGCVFAAEHFYPNDGQMFQVVSNLLSGISGAFLMRVKPPEKTPPTVQDPATTSTTVIEKVTAKAPEA